MDINEIDNLYNYMEKIESIINSDDLQKIEIFRLDNNTVLEEFKMSKHQAWNYRKRVRSKILEAIIGADDLQKIDIFRLDNKTAYIEFNMKKHQLWNYRKRVRNKILEAIKAGELLELK